MKYLFYPFNDGTGLKTLNALAAGVGGEGGNSVSREVGAIYRSDGTFPAGLMEAGHDDEVFVIGHPAEGLKVLGDASKNTIDQTEIVNRLRGAGLRPDAHCKIILYACFSGKGGEDSLAAKVATSLRTNSFACANNVWGFMHKVSMKTHDGALCVKYGKKDWIPYQDLGYVLMNVPPNPTTGQTTNQTPTQGRNRKNRR
ncbi:MAG: hypothetical protein M3348_09185 [Acidobacteriota bacterium]|nr:hypothetical protein [Acidobacteriota bacterium]